jgi:hypothetical protein
MALTEKQAVEKTREILAVRTQEKARLERLHKYLNNTQRTVWLPASIPNEVRQIEKISRVNMLRFVVDVPVQAMYVDGYRTPKAADDESAWETWQRNRMDARQIGIHRSGIAFGASYATVLPGTPVPVIRGASPRMLTTQYGPDDDWPVFALEQLRPVSSGLFRLYDDENVYTMKAAGSSTEDVEWQKREEHGAGVTPVIRFRDTEDLDDPVLGAVEPLIELQDQINLTTFGLLVAQHYGAFRQRYIIGWLAESEEERVKASASKLMTFEDSPEDVQVGEFGQTDLKGYIDSREATLRHMATISQTPAHELLGQLVNLSAEALAAAEASHRRAVTETQTVMGEAWEQVLGLATQYMGEEVDPTAYVRWKDTEARSMSQMADALGKLATMLGVPPQELWERIPGVSQNEIERWKAAAKEGDALGNLRDLLDRQGGGPEPLPTPTPVPAA